MTKELELRNVEKSYLEILIGNERGFAQARGIEIDEVVMQLD